MMSSEIIHICFGIHDGNGQYTKYMACTMCSILQKTREHVEFHVLHDKSLTDDYQQKLCTMIGRYDHAKMSFHMVDIDEKKYEDYDLKRFTVGTLFKLLICDQLKGIAEKAIYLDSDIIVNLDISELWNEELGGKLLGAVNTPLKTPEIWPLLSKGIISKDDYFNTGIILLDIKAICEKHDMGKECIDFIINHPDLWRAPDQDAITYVFKGEIKALPLKYNVRVSEYRKVGGDENCLFHFIADCPRDTFDYLPDRLFFEALRKTPWGTEEQIIQHYEKRISEKDRQKAAVYKLMKAVYEEPRKKKIFWGIRGDIHQGIMDMLPWGEDDYFVDKNEKTWGEEHLNGVVYSPERLKSENPKDTIIIVTVFRYNEIKPILEQYGYIENENFFNGKHLLSERSTFVLSGERESKWDL